MPLAFLGLLLLPFSTYLLGADSDSAKPPEIRKGTAADAKNLYNGKDLSGWWGDLNLYHVENGEIVGKTATGIKKNEFLKSRYSFGDFRLVVKIKLTPNEANSGIQFHSQPFEGNEMAGPQADAGKGWWGKIYGENFGNKVLADNKSGEQVVKPNEWNTYEVLAVGTKIKTAINGHACAEYDAPNVPHEGLFGLQVHAGGPTEARFKDFELELNPKFELKTVK
jgi:3-keto-disaccharide hydrolase